MRSLEEYVAAAERIHGHICAGQILGLRLAMHGLNLLGLTDPEGAHRKRLVTFVEIDRCATDAVMVVIGDAASAGRACPLAVAGLIRRLSHRLARVIGNGNSGTIRRGGWAKTVTEAAVSVRRPTW